VCSKDVSATNLTTMTTTTPTTTTTDPLCSRSLRFYSALVTRGLGLLEGIALQGDPDFDIFQASAPYARRRALALLRDASPGTALSSLRNRLSKF
jgi:predicted unusual protein kinase regulating ubiquinone biosynthesis (AarF/ABC1/UbiB family)